MATYAELITEAQLRFTRSVDGLDHAILVSEPAIGEWNARDVTAHLDDWAKEMLASLECALGGPQPPNHPIADGEAFNQQHAALHTSESFETAFANLDATMTAAADFARRITPEQAEMPVSPPWGGAMTVGNLLNSIVNHHNEHSELMEAWRLARRT